MEGNSLVSIIMAVYDAKPYLAEALESVIHQTYDNLEIIVVDDGSEDGSGRICDEYAGKDSRICVIHQKHKGPCAARNAGLERMKGEYAAFMDSDDVFDETFVEKMTEAIIREKADLVICKYTLEYTEGRLGQNGLHKTFPGIKEGRYDRTSVLRSLADGSANVHVWNRLYKRELFDHIRFPEGRIYEDREVTFAVADKAAASYVLDLPLYIHRKRKGSLTDEVDEQTVRDKVTAFENYVSLIKEYTPGVFDEENLKHVQRARLDEMMDSYIRYVHTKGKKDGGYDKELRRDIIGFGRENDISGYGFKTKTAYKLIRFFPWIIKITSGIYISIRLSERKRQV